MSYYFREELVQTVKNPDGWWYLEYWLPEEEAGWVGPWDSENDAINAAKEAEQFEWAKLNGEK